MSGHPLDRRPFRDPPPLPPPLRHLLSLHPGPLQETPRWHHLSLPPWLSVGVCALTEQLRGQLRRGRGTVRSGGSESRGAGPGPPFRVRELHSPALRPSRHSPLPQTAAVRTLPIPAPPSSPPPPRSTLSSITSLLGHILQHVGVSLSSHPKVQHRTKSPPVTDFPPVTALHPLPRNFSASRLHSLVSSTSAILSLRLSGSQARTPSCGSGQGGATLKPLTPPPPTPPPGQPSPPTPSACTGRRESCDSQRLPYGLTWASCPASAAGHPHLPLLKCHDPRAHVSHQSLSCLSPAPNTETEPKPPQWSEAAPSSQSDCPRPCPLPFLISGPWGPSLLLTMSETPPHPTLT